MRVRRDSDNAELDIGFSATPVNGERWVDLVALEAFAAGSLTDVSVWYDQGPAALHAVMATAVRQPGAVTFVGSFPAVNFQGMNLYMTIPARGLGSSVTVTGVFAAPPTFGGARQAILGGSNANRCPMAIYGSSVMFGARGSSSERPFGSARTDGLSNVMTISYDNAELTALAHGNETLNAIKPLSTGSFSAGSINIGRTSNDSNYFSRGLCELIAWSRSVVSEADSLIVHNLQRRRWGTP